MDEQPKRKRGRPKTKPDDYNKQKAWKERTNFESSEERKKYKAEKAKEYRKRKKQQENP